MASPPNFGSVLFRHEAPDAGEPEPTASHRSGGAPGPLVTSDAGRDSPAPRLTRVRAWLTRHQVALWWLHSSWALAFGIGVMWLGARDFRYLRLAFLQVAFIWASSLCLPRLARGASLGPAGRERVRLVVNYFNRNFYQQVLFFVLPVYWASVTLDSVNVWFVVLVAASAVVSTLDVFYDRHLSVRVGLAGVFFAFNLFACANVALPVLWSVSNAAAMRVAALLALAGFATLALRVHHLRRVRVLVAVLATALALLGVLEFGRRAIPPAPLRVVDAGFGTSVDRTTRTLVGRQAAVPAGWSGSLTVMTAIKAPLGLKDRVRHRWLVAGREVRVTPFYRVSGGRDQGFRLWTAATLPSLPRNAVVQVDVETEGGQLVGRVRLPVE